jgi:protocatechuate 3,4-dioxygenase beta subunit
MRRDVVRLVRQSLVLTLVLGFVSCTDNYGPMQPTLQASYVTPTGLVTANPPQVFIGAGDISSCGNTGDEATAKLLDANPVGTVFNIGDDVYENGTTTEFTNCYHPTWGRHKARTMPTAGNHEYNTSGASGYYQYFGAAAHPSSVSDSAGFYSFDLGAWHIIALNSNVARSLNSRQDKWLAADLAAHPNQCTLAYFHHPLYSSTGGSGSGGVSTTSVRPFWDRLYAARADLVLNGHRHFYERLAPMKPDGSADPVNGIRTIIAGMGGIGGGSVTNLFPRHEVGNGDTRGVLKLYLYDDSYAWKFLPVAGKTFTDSGSTACHASGGGGGSGVSAGNSAVDVAPSSFTAGSGSSTITATVKDGSGNAMSDINVVFGATGTGNTFTPPNVTTNSSGVATSTFTSTGAGAKTVSATAGGVTITQQPTVTVNPGPVSAAVSTVAAAPGTFVAGSGSSTITVTAKDANGNTISSMPVTVASTGSGNTLSPASGSTNSSGVFTNTLTSTVAELKTVSATINGTALTQTAPVNVTTSGGGGNGTIAHTLLTAGSNATNLSTYTTASIAPAPNALITVAVRNHRSPAAISPTLSGGGMTSWTPVASVDYDPISGSLGRLTVFRAMSASPGSGPITITFSNGVSNVDWIVSQWTGVDVSGVNGAGAIGQTGSARGDAVSALSVPLAAFGNANNVAYGAVGARLNAPAVTPGSGFTEIAEVTPNEATLLEAQWATNLYTIQASLTSAKNAALLGIEIKAGGGGAPTVSASQSLVSASGPITVGSGTSNITVTVKDGSGNPMAGVAVTLSATGSGNSITQPAGPTDALGVATGALTSTGAGPKTITAVANSITLTQQPTVNVFAGSPDAAQSTVSANPTSIEQTTGTSTITMTVKDEFGNPVNGASVVLGASGTGNSIGQPGATNASGVTTGTLSSSDIQTETVTATASGVPLNQQPSITITAPVPTASASLSTVVATTPSFTAGGSTTITVTVRDGSNNPMSGVTVTLSATGNGNTVTQPVGTTDGSGVTTGTLATTGAGSKTITAVAGIVTLDQQPVVTVNAAVADAGLSTVAVSPASIPVTTGTATVTVTVKDAFGNPVSGSTVVIQSTGTDNTITGPAGTTNASGVATATLSSTVAESKTVSATADGTPITQTQNVAVTPPSSGITHTLLTAGNDPANLGVYNTASISPAANALVTIAVVGHRSTAAAASPTVTGGGMPAWVEVATATFSTVGTPLKRMSIFRAMSASPGSGPITITFSATESNASWIVSQWTGVNTTGTNGSGAIAQALTNPADGATSISATLAALGSPNNVAYGVVGTSGTAIGINPGAGFTEISEQKPNESPNGILEALFAANQTTPSASWTGAFAAAILAVEIKAGP